MTAVFKVGARTESGWSFLLSKYISIGSEAEKNKILEALASSEDVRKLYWYETNQGIGHVETKSMKTLCCTGGELISSGISLFLLLLAGQTWLGQWGKEPACAGFQLRNCDRQKVLCPESQHPPTFCLNMASPPWRVVFIPQLVLHSPGQGIALSKLSFWKCKHYRKRYYVKAYRLYFHMNLSDISFLILTGQNLEMGVSQAKEGQWAGPPDPGASSGGAEEHQDPREIWKELEGQRWEGQREALMCHCFSCINVLR